MDEDTAAHLKPGGRTINVVVCGDTADEIELAALDEARKFFGPDRQLEVVHDYSVTGMPAHHKLAESGKKYLAPGGVHVRTVES